MNFFFLRYMVNLMRQWAKLYCGYGTFCEIRMYGIIVSDPGQILGIAFFLKHENIYKYKRQQYVSQSVKTATLFAKFY
jgi:hypothetical protein